MEYTIYSIVNNSVVVDLTADDESSPQKKKAHGGVNDDANQETNDVLVTLLENPN
jgi:hypothetical protein